MKIKIMKNATATGLTINNDARVIKVIKSKVLVVFPVCFKDNKKMNKMTRKAKRISDRILYE